jgi:cell division protein FtsQ
VPIRRRRFDLGRIAPSSRSLAVGFGVAALALASYGIARWTPLFAVRSIEVVGVGGPTAAHVRAALRELEGRSLLELRSDDVQLPLAALPDVLSARYDRSFPNTLVVFVRPERAVGVIRRGDESWLVSARGRAIAQMRLGERPALARIWVGPNVSVTLGSLLSDSDTFRAVRTLALPGIVSLPRVRTARIERRDLTLVLTSGLEVRLGHDEAVPLKLAVASRVLSRLGAATPGETLYLDVSVPERPVAGRL